MRRTKANCQLITHFLLFLRQDGNQDYFQKSNILNQDNVKKQSKSGHEEKVKYLQEDNLEGDDGSLQNGRNCNTINNKQRMFDRQQIGQGSILRNQFFNSVNRFAIFASNYITSYPITEMIETLKQFLAITPQDLKKPVFTKQKGDVFYLLLNSKANTFTRTSVRQIHAELDKIQANEGATAMVTVSLSKLFSGGLDLKYISNLEVQDQRYMTLEFIALFGRISVLPFPTFCLVRGGAVAGGTMFAFAHDYVYVGGNAMFSTNEAQNQLHFPAGMLAVIKKRHPYPSALRDMVIFSKQFQAKQALQNKFIDGIFSEEQAISTIHSKASEVSYLGDSKEVLKKIKCELHKEVVIGCFEKQVSPNTIAFVKMKQFPKL